MLARDQEADRTTLARPHCASGISLIPDQSEPGPMARASRERLCRVDYIPGLSEERYPSQQAGENS